MKKALWGFLIALIVIGCSKDDSIILELENQESKIIVVKETNILVNKNINSDHIENNTLSRNNNILSEDNNNLIKIQIKYLTQNTSRRVSSRNSIFRFHDLIVIKHADNHSPYETWGLQITATSGGVQSTPEEDSPLYDEQETHINNPLELVKKAIRNNPYISLVNDTLDSIPIDGGFDSSNGSDNESSDGNNGSGSTNQNGSGSSDNTVTGFQ